MLPKEKDKRLLDYYVQLKFEYHEMTRKMREMTFDDKLNEWLDGPYVKLSLALMAAGPFITWFQQTFFGNKWFLGSVEKRHRSDGDLHKTRTFIEDLKNDDYDFRKLIGKSK